MDAKKMHTPKPYRWASAFVERRKLARAVERALRDSMEWADVIKPAGYTHQAYGYALTSTPAGRLRVEAIHRSQAYKTGWDNPRKIGPFAVEP